ncbi:hypothetical protein ACIOD2_09620 [Amycolatopsis sp. NPDC088138]|uniref:hypothetical protein n=1 Tax=Amycolatopsis sp. NPDC088138 TaxID=3363938 RepID=UPI00383047F9
MREVREETGIECNVTGVIGLYSDPNTSSPTTTARCDRSSRSASGQSMFRGLPIQVKKQRGFLG